MSSPERDLARRLLAAEANGEQIQPITEADPGFDLARAYRVAAHILESREAAGYRAVGRKIGFTNRTIWNTYNVHGPIWAHVYDRTVHYGAQSCEIGHLLEPRIEPEIVLKLRRAPKPDMDETELMGCIGAVAHGFELVQSLFPGWRFQAPDTVAGFGMHGALVAGSFIEITPADQAGWQRALAGFGIRLFRDGSLIARGRAENVMDGGPLSALGHLVRQLAEDPDARALSPGEIVTTGTLTDAPRVAPGDVWTTTLDGIALPGLSLHLT